MIDLLENEVQLRLALPNGHDDDMPNEEEDDESTVKPDPTSN